MNRITADAMADVVIQVIKAALEPMKAELATVRQELELLKAGHADLQTKALKGGLPWQRATQYHVGDCTQHDGSLWRCCESHTSGATFSHEHFLLQIKRGKDGRDFR